MPRAALPETTQVWLVAGGHEAHRAQAAHRAQELQGAEEACAAEPRSPADAILQVPLVQLPVRRDVERTMIIRRPVRRARFDWRVPTRLAAPALMLGVMLALADWSERHPVGVPPVAAPKTPDGPAPLAPAPVSAQPVVEVLTDSSDSEGTARFVDASSLSRLERTGRRGAKSGSLVRAEVGRAGTKPRTRPSRRSATPSPTTRDGHAPPASKTDDETSSSGDAAFADVPRVRPGNGRRNTLAASTAWVDPFASY